MASLSGQSSLAALCVACFSHRKASRAYDLVDSSRKKRVRVGVEGLDDVIPRRLGPN